MAKLILPSFLHSQIHDNDENKVGDVLLMNIESIEGLKKILIEKYPVITDKVLEEGNEFKKSLIFVLNDEILEKEEFSTKKLKQDDEINILFQFAGG